MLLSIICLCDFWALSIASKLSPSMSSFSVEEFVGDGVLKELFPRLLEEGWDDVPTLKLMNSEDMDALNMTQQQRDAMEIRTYLHDRSLMQYADKLESSSKSISQLITLSASVLSSDYAIKRGHIARFLDRTTACGISPHPSNPPSQMATRTNSSLSSFSKNDHSPVNKRKLQTLRSTLAQHSNVEASLLDFKIKEGYVYKGIVASKPVDAKMCGCVEPPPIVKTVAPYSVVERVSVQRLAPEYKIGMKSLVTSKAPPMKASLLWRDKPVVLLCIRRPGCIMCRAEAHQLYARKPIFDALGFQMITVLHEHIDSEVKDFWPRFWGGVVVVDKEKEFFKALGGGKLLKESFLTGFLFNPRSMSNYKRAKATGLEGNLKGEGDVKGGLFVIGRGKSGIAYQFIERNFGDWAPVSEVIEICSRLQKDDQGREELPAISSSHETVY